MQKEYPERCWDDFSAPTIFGAIVVGVWIRQSKKTPSACTIVGTVLFGHHVFLFNSAKGVLSCLQSCVREGEVETVGLFRAG